MFYLLNSQLGVYAATKIIIFTPTVSISIPLSHRCVHQVSYRQLLRAIADSEKHDGLSIHPDFACNSPIVDPDAARGCIPSSVPRACITKAGASICRSRVDCAIAMKAPGLHRPGRQSMM